MLGGWCLLKGLHNLLSLAPTGLFDKTKDTPKGKAAATAAAAADPKAKDAALPARPTSAKGYV